MSPYQDPEDLVFCGEDRKTPIQHREIETCFYSAMAKVGITREERHRRNVSFHSWRHWYNTLLRAKGIADAKVQEVTGHRSQAMTEHYSHFAIADFKDVLAVWEEVFKS
jgi:integrase